MAIGIGGYSTLLALFLLIISLIFLRRTKATILQNILIALSLLSALVILAGAVVAYVGIDRTCKQQIQYGREVTGGRTFDCGTFWRAGWEWPMGSGDLYYPKYEVLMGGVYSGFAAAVGWVLCGVAGFWEKRREY
ncbi:hypothetical protein HK097_002858 [Rhizophlyctis rosea]|uniref:Uncharacterized protein n=1 Tax=Rhizophlyctis rosea TaxID=64517 RepID=A0AAD5S4S5_9FUNG|nr:hypothetical protein HK097_002858 [Rhizophlyctis rosea]